LLFFPFSGLFKNGGPMPVGPSSGVLFTLPINQQGKYRVGSQTGICVSLLNEATTGRNIYLLMREDV
jgi:hypothetical protein